MALRDQPYLPLYVQDVLTDEKLVLCSAEAHGVYFRLLCILHKQEEYGEIKLKQKYKKTDDVVEGFARQLFTQMPFQVEQIETCLKELLEEKVIDIDFDTEILYQKRMQYDGRISKTRTECGKLGRNIVTQQHGQSGYFYLMSDGHEKHKIGISKSPTNRLYRIRSDQKLSKLFEIKEMIRVDDMGKTENLAHDFFAYMLDGEWLITDYDGASKGFNEFVSTFLLEQISEQKQNLPILFAPANFRANSENEIENNNTVSNNIPVSNTGNINNTNTGNNIYNNIYNNTAQKNSNLLEQIPEQTFSEQKQKQKSEQKSEIPSLSYETIYAMEPKERSNYLKSVFENRLPYLDAYRCAWNLVAISHGLASIRSINPMTKGKILQKIKVSDFDFKTLLAKCVEKTKIDGCEVYVRPHLMGENDRGWKITFDWLFAGNKDHIPNYYNVLYNNAYVRGGVVIPTKEVTK